MRSLFSSPVLVLALALSAAAGEGPRLTTDTVEYCGTLVARLSTLPAAGQEPSRSLAEEGMRLCDTGHFRTGIAKLRRAVRAAQVSQGSPLR